MIEIFKVTLTECRIYNYSLFVDIIFALLKSESVDIVDEIFIYENWYSIDHWLHSLETFQTHSKTIVSGSYISEKLSE